MQRFQLVNSEFYHIYNRGVDKRRIFLDEKDYEKFYLNLLKDNNDLSYMERESHENDLSFFKKQEHLVQIVAYSLLPNHFHLLLKQLKDRGIEYFIQKVCTSYAVYFNRKYNRSGTLFQGRYKAIRVDNDRYLTWLSAYINSNVEIHGIDKAFSYKWSSLKYFLGERKIDIVKGVGIILSQFKTIEDYRDFLEEVIKESKEIKKMKREADLEGESELRRLKERFKF